MTPLTKTVSNLRTLARLEVNVDDLRYRVGVCRVASEFLPSRMGDKLRPGIVLFLFAFETEHVGETRHKSTVERCCEENRLETALMEQVEGTPLFDDLVYLRPASLEIVASVNP